MIGRKVYGNGPMPARVMLVGEGPGMHESVQGVPFVGASGADLDYVFLRRAAKLRREDIYVTNIVKWRTDEDDRDPTAEEIARDEPELITEIDLCNPEIIVAVGKVAARWFMQADDVDMEKYVGTPIYCPRYPDKILFCTYHPAAGLHQAERYYYPIYAAFERLGELVRTDTFENWVSLVRRQHRDVHYGDGLPPLVVGADTAVDTEGLPPQPWGLSVCQVEKTAGVLRGVEDSPAKGLLRDVFKGGRVVMHNALHDIDVLGALGTPVSTDRIEDTMLAAYLLPHLPRRLKALSFKLLGAEQNEYEDIIAPAEKKITEDYLRAVLGSSCTACSGATTVEVPYKRPSKDGSVKFRTIKCETCAGDGTNWPAPVPQLVFDDDGTSRVYKPRSIGRRVRELLKRGDGLREGWSQIDHSLRAPVEDNLGGMREPTLDDVDLPTAIHYSAADADLTLGVWNKLEPELKQKGLWTVYEIDKGIIPIIHRMHNNGIRIDRDHFRNLRADFTQQSDVLRSKISAISGSSINPASPLQVADLIYTRLGCKPVRGERGTDDKTMQALKIKYKTRADVCEAIDLIGDYRELNKLVGTYVDPLPSYADSSNRVHTRFLLHVVATGRLSSRDPNLQNIPTRSERGRLIRAGFIPRDGCRLVSVDLDQIELRVAAHISGDANMINVFMSGIDIHRATAALIYGKRPEDITALERLLAKTINFLILYGGGANRLHSELSLLGITTTKDQCVGYINDWFNAYPDVREYIARCQSQAKAVGYVECLFGRRRYVPGVYSCVDKVREESLKWATNFPIQATAAGILKLWMRRVWDNVIPAMASKGICEPLLTIHDELIFEAEEDMCDELIARLVQEAALAAPLSVPIKAKGLSAENWAGLKD